MTTTGKVNVLIVGAGEYTTGCGLSATDKPKGVVAITLFDLQRRRLVDRIGLCATSAARIRDIEAHLQQTIAGVYANLPILFTAGTFPPPEQTGRDPQSFMTALRSTSFSRGDVCCVFTPDDTHCEIAFEAISCGFHVLLAKPVTKTIREHLKLLQAAKNHDVLVQVDFHKRWDVAYQDARCKIRDSGDFSFFASFMSQPKSQLSTFKKWAGRASDISYYLNSHHIDFHCWAMEGIAVPVDVTAYSSNGVAEAAGLPVGTEDTITLVVRWRNIKSGNHATAVYTAGWSSPTGVEVHSQQRFVCVSHRGETRVDQAHRGYEVMNDGSYKSCNPYFMKYTPDDRGFFDGQQGYGYRSIESFIDTCREFNAGEITREDFESPGFRPTLQGTLLTTAILECGRRSLDNEGRRISVVELLHEAGASDVISSALLPRSSQLDKAA